MHPDDTAPNPIPFATARGWELGEHAPSTPAQFANSARVARAWQIGLAVGSILTAPALALSVLFALTTH